MTDDQIKFTAKRLTENDAHHSICLGLPEGGPLRKAADAFFKERELFGISGWVTAEEAEVQIRHRLAQEIIKGK